MKGSVKKTIFAALTTRAETNGRSKRLAPSAPVRQKYEGSTLSLISLGLTPRSHLPPNFVALLRPVLEANVFDATD